MTTGSSFLGQRFEIGQQPDLFHQLHRQALGFVDDEGRQVLGLAPLGQQPLDSIRNLALEPPASAVNPKLAARNS